MNTLIQRLRRTLTLAFDRIGRRLHYNFYLYAALFFTVLAIADALSFNFIIGMRNQSFDTMVKHRFHVAKPASDIVIVDIDEKSLAVLAQEHGRWPWPRQVLGEFVEKIEQQKPKAIVFDILFSDPDIYNAESDAYFNEVIGSTTNTWFPMVRLDTAADKKSELTIAHLPSAFSTPNADTTATIAAVLPFFEAVQKSGRMGFNNIVPDNDGVCREYPILYTLHGFQIPSLPLGIARTEKSSITVPDNMLLNWRGKPFTYKYVSFSDVFVDLRKEKHGRPADEFAGKIVIIGSTAPSLFDIKVTAMDRQFPGVEILATAIDNLRSGDWLILPKAKLAYFFITLMILWATAFGFYRHGTAGRLDQFYGISQFILLGIAYTAINLGNVYINLTGPVMFGFVYYSAARYYAFATERALDTSVAVRTRNSGKTSHGYILSLYFDVPTREEDAIAKLAGILEKQCSNKPSSEWLTGRQKGLWRHFENTLVLCWKADNPTTLSAIKKEADSLCQSLSTLLKAKPFNNILPFDKLTIRQAEGEIGHTNQDWTILLGMALSKERAEI